MIGLLLYGRTLYTLTPLAVDEAISQRDPVQKQYLDKIGKSEMCKAY